MIAKAMPPRHTAARIPVTRGPSSMPRSLQRERQRILKISRKRLSNPGPERARRSLAGSLGLELVDRGREARRLTIILGALPEARPADAGRDMAAGDFAGAVLHVHVVDQDVL